MNKSMLTGAMLGAVIMTAGGAGAIALKQNGGLDLTGPRYADIVQVDPVVETVRVPREVCRDEVATHQQAPADENKVAGTAIGAIVGGLLGNQVGGGNGKKLATAAGAVAGAFAGNRVQGELQTRNTYQTTERVCETAYDSQQNTVGYNVTYRVGEKEYSVQMAEKPTGERLEVDAKGQWLRPQPATPRG